MTDDQLVEALNSNPTVRGSIYKYRNNKGYYTKGNLLIEDATVLKNLSLFGCKSIRVIPDSLTVQGSLHLHNCNLLPFEESRFRIEGDYKIISNTRKFIFQEEGL